MNWERIDSSWKQFRVSLRQRWGKLTDEQLDGLAGKRDELAGKIQEAYGITKDDAEKQVATWQARVKKTAALLSGK